MFCKDFTSVSWQEIFSNICLPAQVLGCCSDLNVYVSLSLQKCWLAKREIPGLRPT